MSCMFRHDWDLWREYEHQAVKVLNAEYPTLKMEQPFVEVRQKRACRRCGWTQDCRVKSGPLIRTDGQNYGFTKEDVRWLESFNFTGETDPRHAALIAKIRALLPPDSL